MFSLLRPKKPPGRVREPESGASPSPGPTRARPVRSGLRHATADFTEADDDDEEYSNEDDGHGRRTTEPGSRPGLPILPLFASTHLDSLPVYGITHAIRTIVSSHTETALSWDQLRSPQIFQFLIKPIQIQLRAEHFSRATLFALMANCLQFSKEAHTHHGCLRTNSTRAEVCQLLAIKMLREYNTRELIDALSYDFNPLQGMQRPINSTPLASVRTSTLDVAVRASAKRFLAHPLVRQHIDAIWSGAITFYSASDSLHRQQVAPRPHIETRNATKPDARTPLLATGPTHCSQYPAQPSRRTVTLYNPRQASLFKLSRLRVPRYRFVLSTMSHAVLIGLFLAVLTRRSTKITGLELVFWFWSAGFMLDEVVGFREHGFSLYIMSFQNILDLAILFLFMIYYCMRSYGVFLLDPHHWNAMAYDVLAANALLLLPRVLGVLNNFQHFSQLLITLRIMAVDLVAMLILITVSGSGFVVFFALSKNADRPMVLLRILEMLLGHTSPIWETWQTYNLLEKTVMVVFLLLCHFAILAMFIAVMTKAFMTMAASVSGEYQFLRAVDTISMVENDSLFSYIPPTNIIAWFLMPLRYLLPFKVFVWLNRLVIKQTHFPILWSIFLYERFWLAPSMFEPTDLVENAGHGRGKTSSFTNPTSRAVLFSASARVREESIAGFRRDQALEEMFRRRPDVVDPPRVQMQMQRRTDRRRALKSIRTWIERQDQAGMMRANWPWLDNRRTSGVGAASWTRRYSLGRESARIRQPSDNRSTASDPAKLLSQGGEGQMSTRSFFQPQLDAPAAMRTPTRPHFADRDLTDADGDDELLTNEEEDEEETKTATQMSDMRRGSTVSEPEARRESYDLATPPAPEDSPMTFSLLRSIATKQAGSSSPRTILTRRSLHNRTWSSNTILFNPVDTKTTAETIGHAGTELSLPRMQIRPQALSGKSMGPPSAFSTERRRSPRRAPHSITGRFNYITAPSRGVVDAMPVPVRNIDGQWSRPRGSRTVSSALSWDADADDASLEDTGTVDREIPSRSQAQAAAAMLREGRTETSKDELSRLVAARLQQLEDTFSDVVREMGALRSSSSVGGVGTAALSDGDTDEQHKSSFGSWPVRRVNSRGSMKETPERSSTGRNNKGKGPDTAEGEGNTALLSGSF